MPTPTYTVEIDWNDNGVFGDANEDVTADVLGTVRIERGRDQARQLSPPMASKASFVLDNSDRRYSPLNASSPIFPDVIDGRQVRIRAVHLAVTYELFRGRIQLSPDPPTRTVKVSALGGLIDLEGRRITTELYEGIRTGTAIGHVLDAVGWPVADRALDVGATVMPWWWETNGGALEALNRLVQSEGPPALIDIDPTGLFTFEDRHHRLNSTASQVSQATFSDGGALPHLALPFHYDHGFDDIINVVEIPVTRRVRQTSQVVFELNDTITLGASAVYTALATFTDPTIELVFGPSNVRVLAGSVASATITPSKAQAATLTVTAGAGGLTFDQLQVTGRPVSVVSEITVSASDSTSQTNHGERSFQYDAPWCNEEDARAVADLIIGKYKDPPIQVRFAVDGTNDTHRTQGLARLMGDRVTIVETEAALNTEFLVEQVVQEIDSGGEWLQTIYGTERISAPLVPAGQVLIFDDASQGQFDQERFAY